MPVKVKCSGCQAVLNVPDRARGKAVKCPKCATAIRVPAEAPAKRKPAGVAAPGDDEDDFLSALDVSRLEDRSTRVCPKCGTAVGAEDVDCPMCGADLMTGGLGSVQRARIGRKGAAPSEYYSKANRDALKYLGKKQALAWKSAFIFTVFGTFSLLCYYMFVWCHNLPPKAFWLFVGAVVTLTLPGWVWHVQLELIQRALAPKREKEPVRFEAFTAVSLGVKSVAWSLFYGWPIWLLFGAPGALMLLFGAEGLGAVLLLTGLGLFLPVALVSWPVAQANFAMPVTWPGWMIHKVLPDVGRNVGPVLYWAAFAVLTAIPVAGVAAGGAVLAMQGAPQLDETFRENSRIGRAKAAVELAEEEKEPPPEWATALASREPKEIDWTLLLWPVGGLALASIPLGFHVVYNARSTAFFVKLFRPNLLHLIGHEKEYVYKPKTIEDKAREAQLAGPYTPYAVQLTFIVSVFVAAVGGAGLGLAGLGYGMGFWISCTVVNFVTGWMWWPLVVYKGFKESVGWGIGMLVPCIGIFVTFSFLGAFPERTKYES
ncbi:MAG TPA: hypothetical protein VF170_05395, partial [Planctomycetaceae bacterium]